MEQKNIDELVELNVKSLICVIMVKATEKVAYTNHNIDEMFRNIEWHNKYEKLERKIINLVKDNNIEKIKEAIELNKASLDDQRLYVKELTGKNYTLHELHEKMVGFE